MQITSHSVEISPQVKALIEEGYMSVHQFNLYILLLKCDVKWHKELGIYQVALKIYLQDQTFYVVHSDPKLETAIDNAFCSLQMKLAKHEDMLGIKRLFRNKLEQVMCWLNLGHKKNVSF
ncbi:HPF/RaiA family ribosome-associated protein [Vibrio breoganii]|uniref:HPF/RaiA family ribosome-associated protein n=1 Tax=Vibrio breoganii TaxID=553239 RepID=UPI000C834DF4|nr:HPF/RaiA family ribosome-associated protein [Vibrio breoganii]PMO54303.1 hypothetical protein BCT07_16915 [Vibrio breoganii]